jgi:hypothetical protein
MLLELDANWLYLFPQEDEEDLPRYAIKPSGKSTHDGFFTMTPQDELKLKEGDTGVSVWFQDKNLGTGKKVKVAEFKEQWDQCLEFLKSDEEQSAPSPSFYKHLKEREPEFIEQQLLRFRYVTWNTGGDQLYETKEDIASLFVGDMDLIFVAFQEVIPLNAKNFMSSQVPVDSWVTKIMNILGEDYEMLQTNKLLGLASVLLSKKDLVLNFQNIEISSIGTGIMNLFGNKGAIATSFSIQEFRFTLLDCHFAAGESDQFVVKRRRELDAIKSYIKLPASNGQLVSSDQSILFDVNELHDNVKDLEMESDEEEPVDEEAAEASVVDAVEQEEIGTDPDKNIILIGGDLNYRIKCKPEMIKELMDSKDYQSLLDYDTLKIEQEQGRILQRFHEGKIEFPPTYKIDKLTGQYEVNRTPSYTDRIFHSESSYVRIESYKSPDIVLSDHRPVYTDYTLQLPLINKEKRDMIARTFLKQMDEQENTKRTTLDIKDLETVVKAHILTPRLIQIKITNTGDHKTYWEIVDTVDSIKSKIPSKCIPASISPERGVLPKTGEQVISVSSTLPIGCKSLTKTIILRGYSAQDYFLTLKWEAEPSYFGTTLDDLHGSAHGGIPQPIYTLIDYLSTHLKKDIFNEKLLNFTQELERKIVRWIDNDQDLDMRELKNADDILDGSSSIAISRVLLLLLRNLDGGVVSEDLSTYLLENFKDDDQIMERVLENLPPLRANVLIYIGSFLRLCVNFGIDKNNLIKTFEPLLLEIPQRRKRDVLFGRKNYDKLRSDFMEILIN